MKNFQKLILIVTVVLPSVYNAQVVKFRKVLGNSGYDYGMSAKQTTDKGYIIGGSTSSVGSGNTDVYVVKTDSLGVPKREKTFGGINIDRGNCVRQTTDGGYIVVGYTNSFGNGGYDVYLIKMDSLLITQWTKTYGGTDWDFGNCVEQTSDGGYILCGSTYSYGKGDDDYYLIKTNSTGDTLWTKTFGGINSDYASSVIQTSDGGYILTGTTKSMGDSLGDFYTVKTNILGDTLWTNKFGGPALDYGNDVLENNAGIFVVGGETQSFGAGNSDGIIVAISNTGQTVSTFPIGNTDFDNILSITETVDGKIAMTGRTKSYGDAYGNGDAYFFIVNSDWTFFNATTFGTEQYDIGFSVEPTMDNAFIVCGYTQGFNNKLDDIYLIKTDVSGLANVNEDVDLTSVNNNLSSDFITTIFPNPAKNIVSLKWERLNGKTVLEIVDVVGQPVYVQEVESNTTSVDINTSDLATGVYTVKIRNNEFVSTKKLVVQH